MSSLARNSPTPEQHWIVEVVRADFEDKVEAMKVQIQRLKAELKEILEAGKK